jgi:uncharacterized protein
MDYYKDFNSEEYKALQETKERNFWAMMTHLSSFGLFIAPLIHIIIPIIIWQSKKYDFPELDEHGKEVLNFNISIMIYSLVSTVLILVIIGIVMLLIIGIVAFILMLIGTVKAGDGVLYRYPLTIRFIK